jgi:hypothetical protein
VRAPLGGAQTALRLEALHSLLKGRHLQLMIGV